MSAPPPGQQVPATGILRPTETAAVANLRRDLEVSPPLAPFVERYWSVRWDRTGLPAHRAEVLSDPSVNVSVDSGTHPRFGLDLPAVLVHAVVTRRFTVDLVGAGRVTAVVLERMREDRTLVRVEEVAADAGMIARTLQRLFARFVGIGPKAVLARHRVQHAVAAIDAGEGDDLATLAASLGWYDQAHLSREFCGVGGRDALAVLRGSSGGPSDQRRARS